MMSDGLRERSKARRREAIVRAAYELFADRGFEATTIADIAAAAEVSPRTVTLYFPSKLELAMSEFDSVTDQIRTAVHEREAGVTILDALEHWLRGQLTRRSDLADLADQVLELNPQLRAAAEARLTEVIQYGAQILAEEQGSSPDDFGPRMASAAAAAVISEVCYRPQEAHIDTAIAFLRAGLATLPPGPAS
ncbi:TetR/AcrR family transcriptional regulator [Streptomyces sp. NBC_00414]|uniref:TetR/AcrR family transcriptional regulator n=1 Tax=Streptomyces sp. NBC_00414 TaxID=2975739 RepID=UPI002E1F2482